MELIDTDEIELAEFSINQAMQMGVEGASVREFDTCKIQFLMQKVL